MVGQVPRTAARQSDHCPDDTTGPRFFRRTTRSKGRETTSEFPAASSEPRLGMEHTTHNRVVGGSNPPAATHVVALGTHCASRTVTRRIACSVVSRNEPRYVGFRLPGLRDADRPRAAEAVTRRHPHGWRCRRDLRVERTSSASYLPIITSVEFTKTVTWSPSWRFSRSRELSVMAATTLPASTSTVISAITCPVLTPRMTPFS